MDDIKQLKSVLRSLVVSSPVQMTLSTLLRDYRNMMGSHLPVQKYGYRDPLQFLKERCDDCFLFQGFGTNTVLTPIVPECLKHIDQFVQKQKVVSKLKCKGKRRSVQESALQPPASHPDLIAKSFEARMRAHRRHVEPEVSTPHPTTDTYHRTRTRPKPPPTSYHRQPTNQTATSYERQPTTQITKSYVKQPDNYQETHVDNRNQNRSSQNENREQEYTIPTREDFQNFVKKRLPMYESTQELNIDKRSYKDSDSGKCTLESEQRTVSSGSSSKAAQLDELRGELVQLVSSAPAGVAYTDLMRLYRARFGRELNFSRFGYTSVSGLVCSLPGVATTRDPASGSLRLVRSPPSPCPSPCPSPSPRPAPRPRPPLSTAASVNNNVEQTSADDALPWIDFDPDVFPADCMSFPDSIPSVRLEQEALQAGDMLELMVGEVYSPSHFWFYRLGERHHLAMEDVMDEMTKYYNGEGKNRWLALGAVRVGHYCSSVYENDWHRSLIVKIIDSENVKVLHVDYGTVDRVRVSGLKPLLRRWAALPAQAVRARLAGARPPGGGRRWPHAACAAFLRLLQDRRLVGNVVSLDLEENIVEMFLIDTATEHDVRIDLELIRVGHADALPHPLPPRSAESYLYPRFEALETGATPNYADIHAYLRDGIALEYVDDYSRHVPPVLPPTPPPASPAPSPSPDPAPSPAPAPAPARFDNRVPLIPRSIVDLSTAVVNPVERAPFRSTLEPEPELECEKQDQLERDSLESLTEVEPPSPSSTARSDSAFAEENDEDVACANDTIPALSKDLSRANLSKGSVPTNQSLPALSKDLARASLPKDNTLVNWSLPALSKDLSRVNLSKEDTVIDLSAMDAPAPPPRAQVPPSKPACPAPPLYPPAPYPSPAMPFFVFSPPQPPFPPYPPQPAYPPPPAPAPAPPRPVYPPAGPRRITTGHGEVTLSVSECEIFTLLSSVDPHAAHWYIVDAISRAMAASTTSAAPGPGPGPAPAPASRLNPEASEFSLNQSRLHAPPGLRPPPGF